MGFISSGIHFSITLILLCSAFINGQITGMAEQMNSSARVSRITLNSQWQFRKFGDADWMPAIIPGSVHEDLLRNGKIPDPYIGTNETTVQWIEHEEWEYTTSFSVDSTFLQEYENAELIFDGLDTYAEVFLNEQHILSANNMFRIWRTPVKQFLKAGENRLLCRFYPPLKVNLPKLYQLPYSLPAANDAHTYKVSVFSRKAPYHFGWDWGPRLVTCGLRNNVVLQGWNTINLQSVQILQPVVTAERAELIARLHFAESSTPGRYFVTIDGFTDTLVSVSAGNNTIDIPFIISKPNLWFPRGYGKQNRYVFSVKISDGGLILDEHTVTTGLRSIVLHRDKDNDGESYYFTVNGSRFFALGADYIPQDNLIGRVTAERYHKLIDDVCTANMNMLRIWGGGYYESELFYNLCDEKGILLWQDFMFACSMYPGDAEFLQNVTEEVRQQVIRLSNHPAVALWCGNNEVDIAWKHWGWQEQFMFTRKDSAQIKRDYDTIFKGILADAVKRNDPGKAFVHTTPLSNWGKPENFRSGSMHYWGVWHGDEPFSAFKQNVPRFMAEYGFQSFPTMPAIRKFASGDELDVNSETMKLHQKSYKGNKSILKYLEPLYGAPKNFEAFVYLSHLTQAYGISYAIRCHRLQKGFCMGTLYWQLNDSWFGPSWSAIDYSGRKKALYYATEKEYKPTVGILEEERGVLEASVVTDEQKQTAVKAELTLLTFTGKLLYRKQGQFLVTADKASRLISVATGAIAGFDRTRCVAKLTVFAGDVCIDESMHFFANPVHLQLPKPEYQVVYDSAGCFITVHAKSMIKNLYFETDTDHIDFSDNYFDLLPGESKKIYVSGSKVLPEIRHYTLYEVLRK